MAVIAQTPPAEFVPSKNDTWTSTTTNNVSAANRSSILITLTDAVAAQTLTVFWGSQSLTFTFTASLDLSGLKLVIRGGVPVADWIPSVVYDLKLNADLTAVFIVEQVGNDIKLTYKDYDNTSVSATTTATGTITTTQATNAGFLQKNLSAFLRVAMNDTIYADYNVPYNIGDATAFFNLRSVFRQLVPFLPSAGMYNYHATTVGELCSNLVLKYRIFGADKFSPSPTELPKTTKLQDFIQDFYAIQAVQLRGVTGDIIALNPDYTRIATATQPNFIYFFATAAIATLTVRCIVTKKDNTTVTVDRTITNITKGQAYAVKAGLTQLWNGDYNSVKSYEVQLRNGATVAFSAIYTIAEKCYKDVINLLVEMPNGGMEVLSLRGAAVDAHLAERDAAQITRSQNYTTQSGDVVEFAKTRQREWRIRTTLVQSAEYAIYEALLSGVLYLINADNSLEKVLLDNKRFDFDKVSQTFDITLKSANINEL